MSILQTTNSFFCLTFCLLLLAGCTGLPEKVKPVTDFDIEQYLGTWYEIARLDHSFERGLEKVSATYSLRKDGGIRVINRGYSKTEEEWQEAEGKAYFLTNTDIGHLKVSFFGPFYGSYAIFELDKEEYQYAFVSGNTHDYLWFLSRTPTVDKKLLSLFENKAKEAGFDLTDIIYLNQI